MGTFPSPLVLMIPWLSNWIIFWIETAEFFSNWIIFWIESWVKRYWMNHFWQNSNIELNQIGYRTPLLLGVVRRALLWKYGFVPRVGIYQIFYTSKIASFSNSTQEKCVNYNIFGNNLRMGDVLLTYLNKLSVFPT